MLKNILTSYTVSLFLLIIGIMSLVQASDPQFLASADALSKPKFSVQNFMIVAGIVFIILAATLIVIKVIRSLKKR